MAKQLITVVREPTVVRASGEAFTPGRMYVDNLFFGHTCEDRDRNLEAGGTKVYAVTAIPRGKYRVITSFSQRFKRVLPELLDVPGFKGIRIHGGNRAEDSEGCILLGAVRTSDGVAKCADRVNRLIELIDDAVELGNETWIEVK